MVLGLALIGSSRVAGRGRERRSPGAASGAETKDSPLGRGAAGRWRARPQHFPPLPDPTAAQRALRLACAPGGKPVATAELQVQAFQPHASRQPAAGWLPG